MLYNCRLTHTGLQCPLSVPHFIPLQSKGRKFAELSPCKRQLGHKCLFSVGLRVGPFWSSAISLCICKRARRDVSQWQLQDLKENKRRCKTFLQTNDVPDLLCPLPSVVYMFNEPSHPFVFIRVGDAQSFASPRQNPKIRWETGKCSWI